MTPVEILTKARALIEKPENWTQYVYARDIYGNPIVALEKEAACFCSYGAVDRVAGSEEIAATALGPLGDAAWAVGKMSVSMVNDRSDHPTVLRMFDLAISKAQASEVTP